ncbi:MAG: hypothetical protein JWM27_3086 [Gemmatimonadetes bacterium]|nr:hypothetical protein [Gemmatimonadota bacterium]
MIATKTDLDLFTPEELETGLRSLLSAQSVKSLLAALARIPDEERGFYRWAHEVVLAVGHSTEGGTQRVRDHYGDTDAHRTWIAEEQRVFAGWLAATAAEQWQVESTPSELLIDSRGASPQALARTFGVVPAE